MSVVVYFFNGVDENIENHYSQKEYRDDIVVEINNVFYEVYFFTKEALEYEMTKEGFLSFPGLVILDEVTKDKICISVNKLVNVGYFDRFKGYAINPINNRFVHKWYENKLSPYLMDTLEVIRLNE